MTSITIPSLVIVEGFLGGAVTAIWGPFEQHMNWSAQEDSRQTIFVRVGPVSSLHDRACELFFALKGGTVDYGEHHSSLYSHSRYGRTHPQGLYPKWSKQHPLHFLGHSMGGPTIMKLQALIQAGHFPDAHPDMIRSVTAVSSPFRGTQLVYTLGERTDSAPAVRPWSIGSFLSRAVHTLAYLGPLLPRSLDLHAESRSLSFQQSSFLMFLKQLWKSDWAQSKDATPYDVTFEAADVRESAGEGKLNPKTFYRSHVAVMTKRSSAASPRHAPTRNRFISLPLYLAASSIGRFDYSTLHPPPSFLPATHSPSTEDELEACLTTVDNDTVQSQLGEEYWANDGVVPVFSQWHPRPCRFTKCVHVPSDKSPSPKPGIWFVYQHDDATHNSLVPLWVGSKRQRIFWGELGEWLNKVDAVCSLESWDPKLDEHDEYVYESQLN